MAHRSIVVRYGAGTGLRLAELDGRTGVKTELGRLTSVLLPQSPATLTIENAQMAWKREQSGFRFTTEPSVMRSEIGLAPA